jgi:hypothetical protein
MVINMQYVVEEAMKKRGTYSGRVSRNTSSQDLAYTGKVSRNTSVEEFVELHRRASGNIKIEYYYFC